MGKKNKEDEKTVETVSNSNDESKVSNNADEQIDDVDNSLSGARGRILTGLSILGIVVIIATAFWGLYYFCKSLNNSESDSSVGSQTITSARGILLEVPSDWDVTNYWEYSQVALTPKSKGESEESSSSDTDLFEGIMITTGYLSEKTELTSFTDEIFKAIEQTSGVDTSRGESNISGTDIKFISMNKNGAYAGMYYMFHNNLAIEIVCSASTEDNLKKYKKDAEDLISKFEYTYVTASDFDMGSSENTTASSIVSNLESSSSKSTESEVKDSLSSKSTES